ncbi:MAG: TetR/AcrR family transcriptional regulator [Rhizobiaceae bacterium]|nr:TetR/AcrR family transcriptional regulator [Rhizobiaceae bacterium]
MGMQRPADQNSETVDRMIKAAEELFAEYGHENVSLRQLTSHAGVNVAAVNYHFGSKELLVEAVFQTLVQRVCDQRELALEKLERGDTLTLEEVVRSFVDPYLGNGNEKQGALLARFLMRNRLYPTDGTRRVVSEYLDPMAKKYIAAFAQVCPKLSKEQLVWRYLFMTNTLAASSAGDNLSRRLESLSPDTGKAELQDRREAMIEFLISAFR